MMELMSMQALDVGAERRREVAEDAMRAAKHVGRDLDVAAGDDVVVVGWRLASETPVAVAAGPNLQTSSDCF